jgi:hypothetical protein
MRACPKVVVGGDVGGVFCGERKRGVKLFLFIRKIATTEDAHNAFLLGTKANRRRPVSFVCVSVCRLRFFLSFFFVCCGKITLTLHMS